MSRDRLPRDLIDRRAERAFDEHSQALDVVQAAAGVALARTRAAVRAAGGGLDEELDAVGASTVTLLRALCSTSRAELRAILAAAGGGDG